MSPYTFAGIYQQSPTAPEGNFFRRAAFRYWRLAGPSPDGRTVLLLDGQPVMLADCWRFATVDVAASTKTSADYTVCAVWGVSVAGDLILLDRRRARIADHDQFGLVEPLRARWRFDTCYVEQSWWSKTLTQDAQAAGMPVAPLTADTDKVTRAIPAAGRVHAGRVWFPAETSGCECGNCTRGDWLDEWCDELAAFPTGTNDDQVDVLAYAARVISHEWTPQTNPPTSRPTDHERAVALAALSATGGAGDGHGDIDLMRAAW
jgi:predicted phage terminase large subunit-like protein